MSGNMKKAQFQMSMFHLLAIVLSIILVIYVGISQNKITMDTLYSNTEAQHLQLVRRMFMSPDCLAYESRNYGVYNNTEVFNVFSARKIYPFILDLSKFQNWDNFNCLRNSISYSFDGEISYTQVRMYYIEVTDLDRGNVYKKTSAYPSNVELDGTRSGIYYEGKGYCSRLGPYFYDTFPIRLYEEGNFYNGLVYIESCTQGGIITREEIAI